MQCFGSDIMERVRNRDPLEREMRAVHPPMAKVLANLQRRWAAVSEFNIWKGARKLTNGICDQIAKKYKLGAGRNLRRLAERASKTGDLSRVPGQGRKQTVLEAVAQEMEIQAINFEYHFSFDAMTTKIKTSIGKGSKGTVYKAFVRKLWKRRRQRLVNLLNRGHMEARLHFAAKMANHDYGSDDIIDIHIDEKWFYAFPRRKVMLYLPPNVEAPFLLKVSESHIPKVCPFLPLLRLYFIIFIIKYFLKIIK